MKSKEIILVKKCVLTIRDWDTFQLILRRFLKVKEPPKKTEPAT